MFIFRGKEDVFFSKQFDFRSKWSTIDALVEITKQNRQGSIDTFTSILFDLRKAFNSLNNEILLAKLEKYVVRRVFSKWFESNFKKNDVSVFK